MTTPHLWGELPEVKDIRTPKMLLNTQASALQEITKGALTCTVSGPPQGDGLIENHLRLIAPSLGNYSVVLVVVTHEIVSYPCIMYSPYLGTQTRACQNEEEFETVLREFLQDEKTRQLIANLLMQIKAENSIAA